MEKKIRRRHYFVKPKLQLHYLGVNLSFAVLVSLILSLIVYKAGSIQMVAEVSRLYPEGIPGFMLKLILKQIALVFLIALPVIVIASIFLSHKVAGPLFKIERGLKRIGAGELGLRIRIRKGDKLHDLVREINNTTANMEKLVANVKDSTEKISHLVKERIEQTKIAMEHIHSDIEHIEADHLKKHEECEFTPQLKEHIDDLDNHLHNILKQIDSIERG